MPGDDRLDRLRSDAEMMSSLQAGSSVLEFESQGEPPDRYSLTFNGKGIARGPSKDIGLEMAEVHQVDMRLSFAYPRSAPDLRWITPIFHPNVSFSGFIHFRDIGLQWDPSISLDTVCERLWDVARLAYLDLENATNSSAKRWIESNCDLRFPVDPRSLRERVSPRQENVVRFQRSDRQRLSSSGTATDNEILYIGEDTPIPPMPDHIVSRKRLDDDDIFYIGDE